MPYEIAFTKAVAITDREQYINDCCVGGDVVVDYLLPTIRARYEDIQNNQEDWGWFIWFKKGNVKLGIDVYTDDPDSGQFRILVTSAVKRLFFTKPADTPELEELLQLVVSELRRWGASGVLVTPARLD